jgi:AAA+ superfamily predicted ATPase
MSTPAITWLEANQRYLTTAIAAVRRDLERLLPEPVSGADADAPEWPFDAPPAIEALASAFELSSFERKILLMCAGVEMDARFAALCSALLGDPRRSQPTFSVALAAMPDAHWTALSPARPLRRWHLVDVTSGEALTTSPLRISGRVLHYLAGVRCLEERLEAIVKPLPAAGRLVDSHRKVAEQIAAMWSQVEGTSTTPGTIPVVELCGDEPAAIRSIAALAAELVRLELHTVAARNVPTQAAEIDLFVRLWHREAFLSGSALLLECDDRESVDAGPIIAGLMESIHGALIVSTAAPRRSAHRTIAVFDVKRPTRTEQAELWNSALGPLAAAVNGTVGSLVSQFHLSSTAIRSAAGAVPRTTTAEQPVVVEQLWDACRIHARPRLEGLAQRIESTATWSDLVLPEAQKHILRQVAVHVRQRSKVYGNWGFGAEGSRGLGISALFAGPSGTGKTMASEVLANELRLDLYRIDLSQVVSKYIGETEKSLGRVFDAAEEGAAVLLFDEADALFGKRTEVKDSHDRYANIEVSYLLQRMESYRGLSILTTNRKSALDQAFLRRIRFVAEFPFPEPDQRAEIWRRVFPTQTPIEGLKIDRLARLNAAGGNIRNIALNAAFLAADAGEPVRMSHLLSATRSEFAKLEKPLTDSEVAGWL